ncbi:MAG: CvpA family protein [Sulfobacillus sp.]
MNAVDIGILLFVLYGLWHGWRRGLIALVISIVSFIIAYVIAISVNQPVATFLQVKLVPVLFGAHPPAYTVVDYRLAALVLVLLVAEGLIGSVTGLFGAHRLRIPVIGMLNRMCGAVVGAAEYLLFASILLFVVGPLVGVHSTIGSEITHSALFQQLIQRWEPSWLKVAA